MKRQQVKDLGYRVDGDCFEVAVGVLRREHASDGRLVHGEVSHGKIDGLRFSHAWVEFEEHGLVWCRDCSNGHDVTLPQALYYAAGRIIAAPQKLARYSYAQACEKMLEHGHYDRPPGKPTSFSRWMRGGLRSKGF